MNQSADRLRVLVIAEAANPQWVSVPLVGWSHARALAEYADVHLVTQVRNRQAIIEAGLTEGDDFTSIDSELVAGAVSRIGSRLRGGRNKGWTTLAALAPLSYYYFEHLVWKQFGQWIAAGAYDVVHRLTPLSPTVPSLLARRCRRAGVPFVLGPLNGGVPWPKGFDAARRKEREWFSYVRWAYKLLPRYRATRRDAAAILIASQDTFDQMPQRYHDKCFYIPENGIDPQRFDVVRRRRAARPIRVVFIGRLVPYKGPDMLIEAAAPLVRDGAVTIELLGDGPLADELKEQVRQEGIAEGVTFGGWIDHQQLPQRLAEADVLAFPSIREFGGGVVLEAMAVGVVPIVVNYGGPRELVTPGTGFLIEMRSRDQIVADFRAALSELAADPAKIESISEAARRRAHQQFTWSAKAAQVAQVYAWVSGRRRDKPHFAMPMPEPRALQNPTPAEAKELNPA